jgi:hypothetical protein
MRIRFFCTFTNLFLLVGLCFGQRAPVPVLNAVHYGDVSLNYMLVVKNQNLDLGNGVDFTATRYFTQHLGLVAEGEATYVSSLQRHEYAVRLGPVLQFNRDKDIQPFVHFLIGYSVVDGPHASGSSVMAGGGVDVRLKGPFFARFTSDIVDDIGPGFRFGRATAGFAYHFGNSRK